MNNFFSELKRRNVVRVAIAYAVVSWVILQFVDVVEDPMSLPEWFQRVTIVALAIGFPIALILSWAYEMTPEGVKKIAELDKSKPVNQGSGQKLNKLIAGALVVALGFIFYQNFGGEKESVINEAMAGEVSIAVLPFINMSEDASNEYFSDGISEELLNLLTKVPDLRVISRSSAFSYKGKDIDLPTVAKELKVEHILAGSVRKSGNQVRITAQLIEASSNTSLWSETYDRTLDDIFATQDEIAARVVEQLKITLLGETPTVRATDPEAYALVLQARYLVRQRTPATIEKSIALFKQALAIDPENVAAWAGLANVYVFQASQGLRPSEEGFALGRQAANQALAIDPNYARAYEILAQISRVYDRDLAQAARFFEQAIQLDPKNSEILFGGAAMARSLGRLDQAIALAEYAMELDPVNPVGLNALGSLYLLVGRSDEAIASFRAALTLSPDYISAQFHVGLSLLLEGKPEAAVAIMEKDSLKIWRLIGLSLVFSDLDQTAEADEVLGELISKYDQDAAYNIAYILAYRGEVDRAFAWLEKAVTNNDSGLTGVLTDPLLDNIRKDPRWLPFLESIGRSPEKMGAIEFDLTLPE